MSSFHTRFLLITSLLLWGCTSYITVQGRVALRGNEPFVYLSITNEELEYELQGKLAETIREKFQSRVLTVKGKVTKSPLGPPKLEVFTIITVE